MNAAEHIVESYFRLCKGCFTLSDRKVENGVGRQLDLLAVNLHERAQLHIEVAVTHRTHWCPTRDQLTPYFEKKFFGAPPERESESGKGTDFEKGKSYFEEIQRAYSSLGLDPEKISRVVVCWFVKGEDNKLPIKITVQSKQVKREFRIEVLSMRDLILPELMNTIGTSNYDDEVLRTLTFIKQREIQNRS